MVSLLVGETIFYLSLFTYATTRWHHGFFIWFYTPFVILRGVFYVFALGAYNAEWHKLRVSYLGFFVPKYYNWLARWFQLGGWVFLVFMLLNIRAIWFVGQVHGWGSSPCGKSSCTRSDSLDLLYAVPFAVYNPTGWFPNGDKDRYDEMGTTRYIFCNFRQYCRWADFNGKAIQSYEKLAGGCELNMDAEVAYEKGFASREHEDYPNPGKGILNGWSPCKLVGQSYPCRGNKQQNTLALLNTTTTLLPNDDRPSVEVTVSDSVIHGTSYKKYFKGKRVCSTCALYQNAALTPILGYENNVPQWKDEDTECVPNVDDSVNPWCFICPGESGAFGWRQNETIDPEHLEEIMNLLIGFAVYILLTTVVMTLFFIITRRRILLKKVPDRYVLGKANLDTEVGLSDMRRLQRGPESRGSRQISDRLKMSSL